MNMRPDPHEPLDPGERELAERLRRAGPLDGPSPALDAKILAAAHAAAAAHKPRRHGRLAWLGVPPALVTGVGVAAAAVLALGLVWQLRPQYGHTASEAASAAAGNDEEVIVFAEPSSGARARAPNPPPLSAPVDAANAARSASQAARAGDEAAAQAQALASAERAERADTLAESRMQKAAEDSAQAEAAARAAVASGSVAPVAADTAAPQAFSGDDANAPVAQAEAEAPPSAPARKSHATYTTAARATAERRERPAPAAAPAPPAAAPMAGAPPAQGAELDRVQVTGTRSTSDSRDWSQIPVSDDARLPAAEWLERIRARRDNGDLANAKASLASFRREHPRVRLPDDLRALLAAGER